MENNPKQHVTCTGSIRLTALNGVGVTPLSFNGQVKRCLYIPLDDNPTIYAGSKAKNANEIYLGVRLLENENGATDRFGNTCAIQAMLSKAEAERLSPEQQKAVTPFLGNLKPTKNAQAAQAAAAPQPVMVQQGGYAPQQPQGGYAPGGYAPQQAAPQGGYPYQQAAPQGGYGPQGGYAPQAPAAPQQQYQPQQAAPQNPYAGQQPVDISEYNDLPPADVNIRTDPPQNDGRGFR